MTDKLDPNFTPTPQGGNPSNGVKRVNKLPLIILILLGSLVTIAITYAALQRGKAQESEHENVQGISDAQITENYVGGADDLLSKYDKHGTISEKTEKITPAVQPQSEPEPMPLSTAQQSTPSQPQVASVSNPPPPPPAQKATDDRLSKRIAKLQDRQLDMFADAVVSNTSVPFETEESNSGKQSSNSENELMTLAQVQELHKKKTAAMLQGYQQRNGTGLGSSDTALLDAMMGTESDPNKQQDKTRFIETERRFGYSSEFRQAPLSPFELKVGTVIPAVLITEINSDLPGLIKAQISQDVRDTRTGKNVLIPQGTEVIGSYDSQVAMGQTRVLAGWHRIQFPDGSTMEIGNMGGTDMKGQAGLHDKVNNHYWRIFGNATLLSLISAGIQLSQPQDDNEDSLSRSEIVAAELGRQYGEVGTEMVRRNMNIQPTLEIRSGYKFTIMVNKDLILEPYSPYQPVNNY
ncbi:hypothetical protein JFQ72_004385 [Vibrio parahaemolyticus]|nr:hypothetical protein [Vibrio parahaemolyticus]